MADKVTEKSKTKSGRGILWTIATLLVVFIVAVYGVGGFYQWVTGNKSPSTSASSDAGTPAANKPRGDFLSPKIVFNPAPPVPTPAPTKVSGGTIPLKKGAWSQVFEIRPGQSYRVEYQGQVAIRYNKSNLGGTVFYHDGVSKTFDLLDPKTGITKKDQLGNPVKVNPDDPGWAHVFQHVQELEYKSLDVDKLLTIDIYQM
jgi:LysM repeat protein